MFQSPLIPNCTYCCRHHVKILGCIQREGNENRHSQSGNTARPLWTHTASVVVLIQAEHLVAPCLAERKTVQQYLS